MSKQSAINYSQVNPGVGGQHVPSEVVVYPSRHRIHWRAPFLIIASLIAGAAFSLGHHLFYAHLNGKEVSETISQTWAIRIGTGFAFIVKMFFGIAVGTSFVQRQWWKLNRGSHRVAEIDSLTTVLENAWTFLVDAWMWIRNPVLLTMALIHWFLPLIAVVTPGSINVESLRLLGNQTLKVPQLYYGNSTAFANVAYQGSFRYTEPQPQVLKVSTATATTGGILDLNFPVPNSTYDLQFYAPTVQCLPVNQSMYDVIFGNVNKSYTGGVYGWVNVVGFVNGDDKGILTPDTLFLGSTNYSASFQSLDMLSRDVARLFVIAAPFLSVDDTAILNIFECQLHNASYQVNFGRQGGQQSVQIEKLDLLNPVAATGPISETLTYDQVQNVLSYQSVMDAFGRLVVGAISTERHGFLSSCYQAFCSQARLTNINWAAPDTTTVQTGLETLFHNITLSLLESQDFLANDTLARDTGVVVTSYPLTYSYDPRDLWLAYGIGASLSLMCIFIGLHALILNEASYQNIFSTFIRSTRNVRWGDTILPSDTGADPVPKIVKTTKIKVTEAVEHSYPLQPMPYQSTPDSMNSSQNHLGFR